MFERAKAQLQQRDENGRCVFDHLVDVIEKVLQSDSNCYDELEHISASIKNKSNSDAAIHFNINEVKEMKSHIDSILKLSGKEGPPPVVTEDAEEQPETPEVDPSRVADIMRLTQIMQWAGIDFGDDWWQLQCACSKLAKEHPTIIEPRFFGKIFGIEKDYYVVEAKLESYDEVEEIPEKMEVPGTGVNEYVYFVCNDLTECSWIKLPYITPKEIKISRECRVHLRGIPDAAIGGRMSFPGNEACFLRCIIAQIISDTYLLPLGYFSKNEETENQIEIVKSEEFTMPEDMSSLANWVHARANLRKEGRLTKYIKPEEDEAEENQEEMQQDPEAEEEEKILHTADADQSSIFEPTEESHPLWVVRTSATIKRPYQVLEIRNKRWPGARTLYEASSQTFENIYVGDAVPFLNASFQPAPVRVLAKEFNEFPEVEDPDNEGQKIQSTESIFVQEVDPLPPADPEPTAAEEAENAEETAEDEQQATPEDQE